MVSRISGSRGPTSTGATTPQPVAVKAATKEKLLKQFNKLSTAGTVKYGGAPPAGVRFVRVPLKADRHPDGYSYTALIPVGNLKPGSKPSDPNKAKDFVIERSGGIAGITQYAGPFAVSGKGTPTDPFFSKFLEGSTRGGGAGRAVTEKYPSDNEDGGGGGRVGGGGNIGTEKYPSDNEDGGGGGRVGGGVSTAKYPSDNEDGGGGSGGGRVGGGGSIGTEKYPSDNEDGGGRTGGGGRAGGGGNVFTEKYPSDNDE
jgi:hypothetical protein